MVLTPLPFSDLKHKYCLFLYHFFTNKRWATDWAPCLVILSDSLSRILSADKKVWGSSLTKRHICTSAPCESRKTNQAPATSPLFVMSLTLITDDRDRKKGNVGWCWSGRTVDRNCWVTFRGSGLFHFLLVCTWINVFLFPSWLSLTARTRGCCEHCAVRAGWWLQGLS